MNDILIFLTSLFSFKSQRRSFQLQIIRMILAFRNPYFTEALEDDAYSMYVRSRRPSEQKQGKGTKGEP